MREKIGTRDGQDFFVGTDTPTPTPTPTPASAATPPANTTPDTRTIPTAADIAKTLGVVTNTNQPASTDGSTDTSSYTIPALVDQEKARAAAQRTAINNQYDQLDTAAQHQGQMEVASSGNTVGQFRGEGFSTAANSYIASVQKVSDDRLEKLRQARETALANLDTESAKNISDLMQNELTRQDKLSELRFNQLATTLQLGMTAESTAATIANTSADNARSAVSQLISAGSSALTGLKPEDMAALETKSGLPAGSLSTIATALQKQEAAAALKNQQIEFKEVNGRVFTFNAQTGEVKDSGITVPKQTTGTENSESAAAYNLKVKQAPAQVSNLAKQGYSWGQIATYLQQQGIDPGESSVDDALHRAFTSQSDYEAWKKTQKTSATDILGALGIGTPAATK